MVALILAGGLGTRLRSVVADRPKPMAAVGDVPFLAHQIAFLRHFGVRRVVLCVGYLHEHIRAYFGEGSAWGVRIDYSVEDEPLGTGGALKLAEPWVDGPFLLLNGDTYFDIDLGGLVERHTLNVLGDPQCMGTLALAEVADARAFGSVVLGTGGRVEAFVEKSVQPILGNFINAGIYALHPSVNECIPAATRVSLEHDVFPTLIAGRRLFGCPAPGFFVDIGTPAGYAALRRYLEERDCDHPQQGSTAHQLRGGRDGCVALRG